jgi:hypothetical protein
MHRPTREQCHTAMQKVPNRNVRGFGWEMAHDAVSRRPPIPLYTMVARTHMYTYDANVWDLSIVQGAFSVAAKLLVLRFATLCIAVCVRRVLTAMRAAASASAVLPASTVKSPNSVMGQLRANASTCVCHSMHSPSGRNCSVRHCLNLARPDVHSLGPGSIPNCAPRPHASAELTAAEPNCTTPSLIPPGTGNAIHDLYDTRTTVRW